MPRSSRLVSIRPIRPNAGTRARYRRRLLALIDAMRKSVEYWLVAQRRQEPPLLASDALPLAEMQQEVHRLYEKWMAHFEEHGPPIASSFIHGQFKATDSAMRQALRDAGWSIQFTLTPAMKEALEAKLAENVALIRSIPAQYFSEIEGIVMRNYAAGRDIRSMALEIKGRYKVASNRAWLIARDQSNKANSTVEKVRQTELGITESIWLHSGGGKEPRPTHLAMNGKRYKISQGMWDSAVGKYVWPGQEINCRCVQRSVLPFSPAVPPVLPAKSVNTRSGK